MIHEADLGIIGAGAAGLTAAIFAAEAARGQGRRILLIDGARKPGAKILVSGGGRCNVTHERVTPDDYWGGPRPIIRNVLRAFDEQRTLQWMRELGVELKLEPTGKYFPVTDKARTVLDALFGRAEELGAELHAGVRVSDIRPSEQGFELLVTGGVFARVRALILATGGLALPKSGSDGAGLQWMKRLGHTIVPVTPALAPLVLEPGPGVGGRFAEFSGMTLDLRLALFAPGGKKLAEQTGGAVFTHFGISGPAPMNLSRHIARYRLDHPGEEPRVTLGHPALPSPEDADRWLQEQIRQNPKRGVGAALTALYPERLARALAEGHPERLVDLTRAQRLELARNLTALPLHGVRDRGYTFAETTAGGVELREVDARTMASRKVPGLYLCGEILDVDGRIGGFNFQWAWSTGYLAGRGAMQEMLSG